jgi:hypothetical protein
MDAVELLQRLPSSVEGGQSNIYKRILAKKDLIAYENRDFRQAEANEIAKLADRFYAWTASKLPAL